MLSFAFRPSQSRPAEFRRCCSCPP
jgi:hypothetical protein